jgi:hypothetical protein
MTTKLKIFNKSLIKLGCETISAITDNSKSARLINEIYDDIVNEELQKHNWIFAKRQDVVWADDIFRTIESIVNVSVDDVELDSDRNVLKITAASVGVSGNDIVIKSSNKNIVCSGATLQGGTVDKAASGTITFNTNIDKGDTITIGDTVLVAGTDFEVGVPTGTKFLSRQFNLPDDLLLLIEIDGFNALSTFPYQYGAYKQYDVAGRSVFCNKNSIAITYTAKCDESNFDFNFVNALCCRICYELADVLTEDDRKKQTWMNEYLLAIRDAKRVNAIQLPNVSLGSGVLERARVW